MQCIYCHGNHWVANCTKIPEQYLGRCVGCWKTSKHQVKNCPNDRVREPWKK